MNNLKSDTIRVGQKLVLGVSNDKIIGEKGLKEAWGDYLLAGGVMYGAFRGGIAAGNLAMDKILSTEIGIRGALYGGLLIFATREGLKNGRFMLNQIQSIPGIGNGLLMYMPRINNVTCGFIEGFTPSGPIGSIIFLENIGWLSGWATSKLLE